ncbi:MAG: hypothetical protein HND44_08455 [Chloroflexi bacterium]|nr:hypothetical protein [Ardenticatenaceae bacterium]MBL1128512.1 hypothetical protein [Chloroflexota bacterium]NOG34590.1 hypothetical protein [Chloroflexota bacterium]GIK56670.1 MAG: hypothetical protein BroJett015_23330 [Chloroflexota bacterium]
MERLTQQLLVGGEAAIAGVRGLGGLGKTELAIAVVQAIKGRFRGGVIWLECGPLDVLVVQGRLAQALGVELKTNDLAGRADVLRLALRARKETLVVLDDVRLGQLTQIKYLLPPRPPCAVLVTSRRDDLVGLPPQSIMQLKELPDVEGENLLAALLADANVSGDAKLVQAIARELENIPLALELAAGRAARLARTRPDPLPRCWMT